MKTAAVAIVAHSNALKELIHRLVNCPILSFAPDRLPFSHRISVTYASSGSVTVDQCWSKESFEAHSPGQPRLSDP
jgi:hypothetical protein